MEVDPIVIRGAREHNLKNISLEIPSQKLVVITGPSGSGKSSLAFDTLYAEGQRRYMESLSAYARQFLDQLSKPDVDFIDGLSPAVAIEQKTISSHIRSTVGTVTNIYDFLRLLFARVGVIRDPETGSMLRTRTNEDIIGFISTMKTKEKIQLLASVVRGKKGEYLREFEGWRRAGFSKIRIDKKMHDLHDPILLNRHQHHDIEILLDVIVPGRADCVQRIQEALNLCDKVSGGWLKVIPIETGEEILLSKKAASSASGKSFPELEPRLFSFNSPYGMCQSCKGVGFVVAAVKEAPSRSRLADPEDDEGEPDSLEHLTKCPACQGSRLRPESLCVFFAGKTITELSSLSCKQLMEFFASLPADLAAHPVTVRLNAEISARLSFLEEVGVGYLSLGRHAGTLSGGEAQRIRLATQLGTNLSGVLYVLDEPSIGLHPKDQDRLLKSLKSLRDLGNSVLVVEHDEETMLQADYIVDIGPGAGVHGGEVIAAGTPQEFLKSTTSQTAQYLRGDISPSKQRARRPGNGHHLSILNCTGHNLKGVDLNLPLGKMVVFTGVSGSGKSSLVRDTLEAALAKALYSSSKDALPYSSLKGLEHIDKVVRVDQRAIGRSPRSNPATYTGLFAPLRIVYSQIPEAQIRGYTPGTFSFNVKGGRCDACEGAGRIKVEMHFLADVFVPCETCLGSRYRREILDIRFKGKSISEILDMPVEQALTLLANQPTVEPKLRTLVDVGLGYIRLGQSATTISGGEAQRIKLAKELSKRSTGKTLYFLDEPTTGLHFEDVRKLLELLQKLCDTGNTIVLIEHNLDVICAADWVVDIGPGPGEQGGKIIFEGTPEALARDKTGSPTASYTKEHFSRRKWSL